VTSPEDLVAIPGTDWIVVSGFERGGALHVVNTRNDRTVQVFPAATPRIRPDSRGFPACPGPPDPAEKEEFRAHGLNVRPGPDGIHTAGTSSHEGTRPFHGVPLTVPSVKTHARNLGGSSSASERPVTTTTGRRFETPGTTAIVGPSIWPIAARSILAAMSAAVSAVR
jgi:hypothetical protein